MKNLGSSTNSNSILPLVLFQLTPIFKSLLSPLPVNLLLPTPVGFRRVKFGVIKSCVSDTS